MADTIRSYLPHDEILNELVNVLKCNNYPKSFINKVIKHQGHMKNDNKRTNSSNKEIRFSIPYIGNLSVILKNKLEKWNPYIQMTFCNFKTTKQLFYSNLKDKTDKSIQSNVIYNIPYKDCDAVFI